MKSNNQHNKQHSVLYKIKASYVQVTGALNMLVRASTQLETNIVSAERIKEYAENEIEVRHFLGKVPRWR